MHKRTHALLAIVTCCCGLAEPIAAGDAVSMTVPSEGPVTAVKEVTATDPLPPCCSAPGRFAHLAAASSQTYRFGIETVDSGLRVLIDDELFAEYRTDVPHQPAIWPIVGPTGHEMTRSYPLGPTLPHEKKDHPHHESLWFAHGNVNGHDFWHVGNQANGNGPHIKHVETLGTEASNRVAVIGTTNAWVAAGETLLTDRRNVTFGVMQSEIGQEARYIDFKIDLVASHGPVEFGDTKEGTFGIRVPGTMKRDAGLGGGMLNDAGDIDDAAWGKPARWVAYHGPLAAPESGDAPLGGIVLMSHPESDLPVCRWHVRGYGLFAANPFGVSEFPNDGAETGGYRLEEGKTLTLRYRVVLHAGRSEAPVVQAWYDDFAATRVASD